MPIIQFACENPVKVTVAVLLAVLFGTLALFDTPVQLTPDTEEPELSISTLWPGASALEVEKEIVDEQEDKLKSVEGLREFTSSSGDSNGSIVLKFPVGTDLADARSRISDKLNQVPQYPVDAREPTISEGGANTEFIAWAMFQPIPPSTEELESFVREYPRLREPLAKYLDQRQQVPLSMLVKLSREDYPEFKELLEGLPEPTLMRKFAEDIIEARLERVPGVSNSNVVGGREVELRVVVDPYRLAAQKLTISDLRRALQEQNQNTSAGDIWEGKLKNIVRTVGQFESVEAVAQTVIALRDNAPVRIADVAEVQIDYKKPDGMVRQKGVSTLAINCQQTPGTNVLKIMGPPKAELDLDGDGVISELELSECKKLHGDSIRIAIEELNIGVLKQRGMMLEQVYDQTEYIDAATELVQSNIYLGGGLAIFVLLLFLRSPRSVIIIGLSIPVSIVASFLFIRGFDRSINVISLAGMAFAVGMVVDNSIVVLENIYRRYQLGESPRDASIRGTTEVWGAVLASTLTTLAVFIPVIFVQGQAGQLFRDIAIAISCAVGLSLIVSVTVIPTAAMRILKPHTPGDAAMAGNLGGFGDNRKRGFAAWVVDKFSDSIGLLLRMPGAFLFKSLVVIGFVAASIFGSWLLLPKTEYLPEGNRNLVFAILLPPQGYNLDQLIKVGERVETDLAKYWEAEAGSPEEAALDGPRIEHFFFVARGGRLFMGAKAIDPLRAGEMVPVLRKAAGNIPGMIAIVNQSSIFAGGLSGGRAIDIEIIGPDLDRLNVIGQKVFFDCLKTFPPQEGHQSRPGSNLESANPEFHVVPIPERAADVGLSAGELGYTINALIDGAFAGDYWHNGRKIDLVLYGADDYTRRTQDISQLPIATPSGNVVNVGTVADVSGTGGPEVVNHIERQRSVTIQVKPAPTMPLETAIDLVDEQIRRPILSSPLAEGGLYNIRLAGSSDKLQDARREMQGNLILAFIITYLLMAGLFESFMYPAIIMTSVLLAGVGGFGGLKLLNVYSNQPLDVLTMLGFVILIGTTVNNAILIVHQSLNNMREGGMPEQEAIVDSVRTRIRPIFMSTMTTVLGMAPLVIPLPTFRDGSIVMIPGAGSELYRGLGSVVLGGLMLSTLFTLILVPIGFSLMLDLKRFTSRLISFRPNAS
ncbi:MAG: efflux RND transporter permease subunit [Planctomycetaceae bacterium]